MSLVGVVAVVILAIVVAASVNWLVVGFAARWAHQRGQRPGHS